MPEDLKQKISQFLDDELDSHQALGLLKNLQSSPELQATYKNYEAISNALKTEVFVGASADFASKIHQQIQQEPIYFLPQKKSAKPTYQCLAIAASVAAVAVLAGRQLLTMQPPGAVATPVVVAKQTPVQPAPLQIAQQQASKATVDPNPIPLNKRINDYLQAHNNSVYTNGGATTTLQPYARVTTYSQK